MLTVDAHLIHYSIAFKRKRKEKVRKLKEKAYGKTIDIIILSILESV